MKKRYLLLTIFLFLLLYLFFYPTPINPGSWTAPAAPTMTGQYAHNQALQATRPFAHPCYKCEEAAVDSLGRIYGGSEEGEIWQFDNPDAKPEVFVKTKGRPLGMIFDAHENLILADSDYGLFSISPQKEMTLLVDNYQGEKFGFTNDLEIAADGKIYFTDASWKFPVATYKLDLLEHQPNGALYVYDPLHKSTERLLDDLYFANGVAVSPDQQFVLVAETGKFRIKKYWLQGAKKGQAEILIENLPGFPDGISSGTDGIFWIAIVSPRNPLLDKLMDKPFLRKVIVRLPHFMQPAPQPYATVIGIDAMGKVRYNLQDPEGNFSEISNVREANGQLYFGTLGGSTLGVMKRP